ncbi:MAG: VanZ family protein [Nitrosomonadales bacterium]|nr:VanZ family protein [Nitrosomonadales bacterium]
MADIVQNVLVYAPLGLFAMIWLVGSMRFLPALIITTLAGTTLSFIIENIQQFIPSRVASTSDLAMNLLGTLAGGTVAALFTRETFSGAKLSELRNHWFRSGQLPNLGLISLALWTLSQTSPLVPSLDIAHLRHGLSLLFHSLKTPGGMVVPEMMSYALYIAGLGLLTSTIVHREKSALPPFLGLIVFVLMSKVLVEGRQLSLEALTGAFIAVLMLIPLRLIAHSVKVVCVAGIFFIATGFALSELTAVPGAGSYTFNWIPFSGQMSSLNGLQNILDLFWPFFAIAYFTRHITPDYQRDIAAPLGGVIVFSILFTLEWFQQYLPGRYGDITQVMIGLSGWIIPWYVSSTVNDEQNARSASVAVNHVRRDNLRNLK